MLEQVEQFGNLQQPDFKPVNIHDVLDRARRSALLGFGADMTIIEDYDPSLPLAFGDPDQILQVVLNLLKNASEAAGPDGGTIRCAPISNIRSGCAAVMARAIRCPCRSRSSMTGRACPRKSAAIFSTPLCRARKTAPDWGWRWSARSSRTMTAGFQPNSVPGRTVFKLSLRRAPAESISKEST